MRPWNSPARPFATIIELLIALLLLLGILVGVGMRSYLRAEPEARRMVDQANVRLINSALGLYRFKHESCPADAAAFSTFVADPAYFPEGMPVDPHDADGSLDGDDYAATYDPALCRVQMSKGSLSHATGAGHD